MQPFFSIIVPMYNSEKYIAHCLNSMIAQSFEDFEILVVDDGSTDASGEIVSSLQAEHTRIRMIRKENGGVASARNKGIEEAAGKYLVFIDADDICLENALLSVHRELDGKEVDLAICGSYAEFSEDAIRVNRMFSDAAFEKTDTAEIKQMCQNLSSMCIGIYRREFLLQNGLRVAEGITCAEDTDFYFSSLCLARSVSLIDCAVFGYRYNQSSVSNNLSYKNITDVMAVCRKHLTKLYQSPPEDIDVEKAKNFFASKYIHFAVKSGGLTEKKACVRQIGQDKPLLQTVFAKPDRAFVKCLSLFGASFAVTLFYHLVNMRNTVSKG